jgi:hypothetical protein
MSEDTIPLDPDREIQQTTTLGPKAMTDLLERLRPLVYVNGACSCCQHTIQENADIGKEFLAWWSDHNLDNTDQGATE